MIPQRRFSRFSTTLSSYNTFIFAALFSLFLLFASPVRANNVAVLVGNSDYSDSGVRDLQFADDDARLLAKTLIQSLHYRKEDVCILTSHPRAEDGERESTAKNVSDAITLMANRQADLPQSTFLFFASAHGVETAQGAMLAVKDYNPAQPLVGEQAELTAKKLTQRLSGLKSGLVVALFDICRKDGLLRPAEETQRSFTLPEGKSGRLATFFSSVEGPSFECTEASRPEAGHGYFTYYVCQGLTMRQTKENTLPVVGALDEEASAVTLQSLKVYVRWNLLEATRNLPGAGAVYGGGETTGKSQDGRRGKTVSTGATKSGLGGQLPDLVCYAGVEESSLIRYERGTCLPEISLSDQYAVLRNIGLNLYQEKSYAEAATFFSRAFQLKRNSWAAYIAGLSYHFAGKDGEAEIQYRAAIAADPKVANAIFSLGTIFESQGKFTEAEIQYRAAIAADPKNADVMFILGLMLDNQAKAGEAEIQYRAAIAADPKHSFARYHLGHILADQGEFTEAEIQYRAAIAANPKFANAVFDLGKLLTDQGKLVEAEVLYHAAIAADPKNADAMANLGKLLADQGKASEAEVQYRAAIVADPKNAIAMFNLGIILENAGKVGEAEVQYRAAVAADPKFAIAMNNLGSLLYKQTKASEAEVQYRAAIAADPKNAPAMTNLGKLLADQGKLVEAEVQYHAAIAADPNYTIAMFNLGVLFQKQDKIAEAEIQYRAAIAANPKLAPAMNNLGSLLHDQGKASEAEVQYRAAIAADPKNAIAMFNLGIILEDAGKVGEAEVQYRAAIVADPKNADAMFNLGVLFYKQGEFVKSEVQWRAVIEVTPDDGLCHANLALVLLDSSHKDQAMIEAKKAQELGLKSHPVFEKLGLKTP